MAKILEHHGKSLMQKMGIAVPEGVACGDAAEVNAAAQRLGGKVMIKALVPVGGRGKMGAVLKANSVEEACEAAGRLLGTKIREFPCDQVLVEKCADVKMELYGSITFNPTTKNPVLVISTEGGVDIESVAKDKPQAIKRVHIDILKGLKEYQVRQAWEELGLDGQLLRKVPPVFVKLYELFRKYDLRLVEVNPFILTTDGEVLAADAVITVQDDVLYRQPELKEIAQYGTDMAWRPPTPREQIMIEADKKDPYRGTSRYMEFDTGTIGFMCGGGGGSMVVMDALVLNGARPKNYTEMGGNPTEEKLVALAHTVLTQPGIKGYIRAGNISSNTQIDLVAKAVVKAVKAAGIDPQKFPMVVRAAGLHDDEAKKIFDEANISYFSEDYTLVQAAKLLLQKVKEQEASR